MIFNHDIQILAILSEDVIREIEQILEEGRGNTQELEHILRLLKSDQPLPPFDKAYLDRILAKNAVVYRGANRYKSEGTTLVLSLFFGILGFMGVGHRYVGNVARSISLLYAGGAIMISAVLIVGIVASTTENEEIPPFAHSNSLPIPHDMEQSVVSSLGSTILIGIAIALPIGYLALFVWQILDARRQARLFNDQMDKTGKEFFEVTQIKKIAYAGALVLPILSIFALAMIFGFFGQPHMMMPTG